MPRSYVLNEYTTNGDITYLNIGYKDTILTAIIDTYMYPEVSKFHWRIVQKKNKFYAITGQFKNGKRGLYLHRLCCRAMVYMDGYEIDHDNGNSLDNRRCNLKFVSRAVNVDNTSVRSDSKSGIRGVSFSTIEQAYRVDFAHRNVRFYTTPFKTIEEATYCRYCFEKYFDIHVLERNEVAMQHINNLNIERKNAIEFYVNGKITEKINNM